MISQEVGNWQRFLNYMGFGDADGNPLTIDESFGAKTIYATCAYQASCNLPPTGVVDSSTKFVGQQHGFIPFVPARHQKVLYPYAGRKIRLIVLHTMENPEKPCAAKNVAEWFAGPTSPTASAHYLVDTADTFQGVRDCDVAYHAPGANNDGIGVEHAGYAKQSASDWQDTASQMIVKRSATLVKRLAKAYAVPMVRLSAEDIKAGKAGLCGHVDVSQAYGGTHWDPGPGFVWQQYLRLLWGE